MRSRFPLPLVVLALCCFPSFGQRSPQQSAPTTTETLQLDGADKVPPGVIIVKGAWSSASDSTTPVPEGGGLASGVYRNDYFSMTYPLPHHWTEEYKGPPPSDHGRYVLAQITPANTFTGPARGTILITAEDMFFTSVPAANAVEFVNYSKDHLQREYKLEQAPQSITFAGRSFSSFKYWAPAAELHWYVLATEIRCHTVEVSLTSRDRNLLESLMQSLKGMKLPAQDDPDSGGIPVCIKNYATDGNVITRVEPVFTEPHYNPVPVRIIIDASGTVKHIHFLSAFPDQIQAVTDALKKWKFKPYMKDGKRVEVETGLMFGRTAGSTSAVASTTQ